MLRKLTKLQSKRIQEAYQVIKDGGLAIIPSRVGYTLLGNSDQAIQKMYKIKGRPLTKPCVVLTQMSLLPSIASIPELHLPLIESIEAEGLLCGFILPRQSHPIFTSLAGFTHQNSQKMDGTTCFVINGGAYIQELIKSSFADGTVVVGSSANKSGTGNEGVFAMIPQEIREQVDFALDDDEFVHYEYNPVTREQGVMIDLNSNLPVMIRKGLKHERINELMQDHIAKISLTLANN